MTLHAWGGTYGGYTIEPSSGNRYMQTRKICNLTRMESLQNELRALINSLSADTKSAFRHSVHQDIIITAVGEKETCKN